MEEQKQQQNKDIFIFRLRVAKGIFLFMFFIIFSFLVKIQIVQSEKYAGKEKKAEYRKIVEPSQRGNIYDRNGKILAMSIPVYSVSFDTWMINYKRKKDPSYPEKLKKKLSEILGIEEEEIEKKMKKPYSMIKRELTLEEYKKIKREKIEGITLTKKYKRVYPYGNLASHILGCTNIDGEGIEGIELYYNGLLRGQEGVYLVLKDGSGKLIPSIRKILIAGQKGKDIYLTIDANIQFIVEEEIEKGWKKFNAKSISAIVMNSENGEILAMANRPDFDPNHPGKFPPSYRRNRAVTDLFEPGSVFKIVTATAVIEENVISPEDIIECENGKWFVRNHYIHDVHPHKKLTFEEVIIKSSNIGTVKAAMELGEKKLYEYCRRFGFGEKSGIDLPGEIKGILRPLNMWSSYSITAVPIGQEVGINSVQGIRAMAVLANGGYLVQPHLLKEIKYSSRKIQPSFSKKREKIISERTAFVMEKILEKVVSPEGTAPLAYIPGYRICGKTGTAQKVENGKYSMTKFVASFIGFLLDNRDKIIISINVDEPQPIHYGGLVAAPIFRNIMLRILQYKNIPPDEKLKGERKIVWYRKNETERYH
ncbi:penicillin-binding protein 2 [bacterium]|nr:penicillin-binding protein 2 [bacterium]